VLQELHQFFGAKCVDLSSFYNWVSFIYTRAFFIGLLVHLLHWNWLRKKLGQDKFKTTTLDALGLALQAIMLLLAIPESIFFAFDFEQFARTDSFLCLFDKISVVAISWMFVLYFALTGIRLEIRDAGITSSDGLPFLVVKWEEIDSFSWTGKNDNVLTLKLENKTKTFIVPDDRKPEIDSLLADRGLDRADPP